MLISDFRFELPEHLIAQQPLENREDSRMLFVDRSSASFADRRFTDFAGFLRKGDLVVLNDTKVFPARLTGRSETGASVEIFLLEEIGNKIWLTLARPVRRLKPGKKILFGGKLSAEVIEKTNEGKLIVKYETDGDFHEIVQKIGRTPLPPYIKRANTAIDSDRSRYQTIYAARSGAIAAPTAGLHFSQPFLDRIGALDCEVTKITLHVGYGTFEPVRVSELSEHSVAPERFEIREKAASALNRAINEGRRIVAVGTTTTRALECAYSRNGNFDSVTGLADLTITPGYKFQAIDALLTNFHLPQSSLLVLVSTFGGHELIMNAYRHAVASRYRFYSYGDCMFIV